MTVTRQGHGSPSSDGSNGLRVTAYDPLTHLPPLRQCTVIIVDRYKCDWATSTTVLRLGYFYTSTSSVHCVICHGSLGSVGHTMKWTTNCQLCIKVIKYNFVLFSMHSHAVSTFSLQIRGPHRRRLSVIAGCCPCFWGWQSAHCSELSKSCPGLRGYRSHYCV